MRYPGSMRWPARAALSGLAVISRTAATLAAVTVPGTVQTASIWQDYLHDSEEHKMNNDQRLAANEPGRRDMTTTYRRSGGLAVLVAAAAIGLAACSSGSSSPQVASLGTSSSSGNGSGSSTGSGNSSGSSTATGSAGNPTQLVDEWAACMRSHGDPSQADPVINSDGDIEITMTNASQAQSSETHDSSGPCGHYLTAASTALRGGQPAPTLPSQAQLLKYAECMRANGEPNYPDPVPGSSEGKLPSGVDPNSPVFQNANNVCAKQTGMPAAYTGAAVPGIVQVRNLVG
jgi:hypothetical protein